MVHAQTCPSFCCPCASAAPYIAACPCSQRCGGYRRAGGGDHGGWGLPPADLIERLISEVKAFAGDEPQADDMTCVVIKVEA